MSDAITSEDQTGRGLSYLNMVVECSTSFSLSEFQKATHDIQKAEGRTEESKSLAIMPLDIDIITWDNDIINVKDYESTYFRKTLETLKTRNNSKK